MKKAIFVALLFKGILNTVLLGFSVGDQVIVTEEGVAVRSEDLSSVLFRPTRWVQGSITDGPKIGTVDGYSGNWWCVRWCYYKSIPPPDGELEAWIAEPYISETPSALSIDEPDFQSSVYLIENNFFISGNSPFAESEDKINATGGAFSEYAHGNCTWYAQGRLLELGYLRSQVILLNSNANSWDNIADKDDNSLEWEQEPEPGSVAQTDEGEFGHVAVVESVNQDGTITISESSYSTTESSPFNYLWRLRVVEMDDFEGFIHASRDPDQDLWAEAENYDDGWLNLDWFGWFKEMGSNWIYHAEHQWLYPLATGTDNLYLFDYALGLWYWTSDTFYPLLYKYGDFPGWVRYSIGGAIGNRWFFDYNEDNWQSETDWIDESEVLHSGKTILVNFGPQPDEVHYSFHAERGDSIDIAVSEADNPYYSLFGNIVVINPMGVEIDSGGLNSYYLEFEADQSGQYGIILSDRYVPTNSDEFRLTFVRTPGVQNDPDGFEIESGELVNRILPVGDIDVFTFDASRGDSIDVVAGDFEGSVLYFDPYIKIYSPDGSLLGSDSGFNGAHLELEAQLTGMHYLLVRDASAGEEGEYHFTMVRTPSVQNDPDGFELESGETVHRALPAGDIDVFTFVASRGTRIDIEAIDVEGSYLYFDPYIKIYSPDGSLLGSDSGFNGAHLDLEAQLTGTHYVLVRDASAGEDGEYLFTINLGSP